MPGLAGYAQVGPRSRGVFDPALGRFVDSVTKVPTLEIDYEAYLERLRMIHQPFETDQDTRETSYSINENQGNEVRHASGGSITTRWGSYLPYSSPGESRMDSAQESKRKEDTANNNPWYNVIFRKDGENEQSWHKYKPSKSLWDGMSSSTPILSNSHSPSTNNTPFTPASISLMAMTSRSRETCKNEPKQDLPEKAKEGDIKRIWQSLLCCCRQQKFD